MGLGQGCVDVGVKKRVGGVLDQRPSGVTNGS
jgi:hypothetical protein